MSDVFTDSGFNLNITRATFLVIVFLVMMVLFWSELVDHDCIGDKECNLRSAEPEAEDSVDDYIDKLSEMIQGNSDFIIWRRALIVSILVGFFVVYFMRGRIPEPMEWIIVGLVIFIGAYFAASWLCSHFLIPNTRRILDNLEELKIKVTSNEEHKQFDKKLQIGQSYQSVKVSATDKLTSTQI